MQPNDQIPCTPTYTKYQQTFNNWTPLIDQPMDLITALAESCDTYFYELGRRFYVLPPNSGHPLQEWANRFGLGQPTGVDVGPETAGLMPTPEWRRAAYPASKGYTEIDRTWKPGYSIQLAIGQGQLLVTPLQMARVYAMIANGGKLVSPHLAEDVEAERRQRAAARPADVRRPAAGVDRRRPHHALLRAARSRGGDALAARHLVRRLRQLQRRHRRQDRVGREGSEPARLSDAAEPDPVVVVRLRAVRQTRRSSSVRSSRTAATAARQPRRPRCGSSSSTSTPRPRRPRIPPTDGDRSSRLGSTRASAPSPRAGDQRRRSRPAPGLAAAGRARRARGVRPVGDRRDHQARPGRLGRPAARALRVRRRRSCSSVPCSSILVLSTLLPADLLRHARDDAARARSGRGDPGIEALARRRLLPVPAVGVREGAVRARDRRIPGRSREGDLASGRGARRDRLRPPADPAGVRPAGHRHRVGLHGRARGGSVRRPAFAGSTSESSRPCR